MAKDSYRTCDVCGKRYSYCPTCTIRKPDFNASRFCCKDHEEIFEILSKNGCNITTAEETLKALKNYDTNVLVGSIKTHFDSLKPNQKKSVKSESKESVITEQE